MRKNGRGSDVRGAGAGKKIRILGGGTRKKNKEKKGSGVGRKKLGWSRGVEYLGVGGPDPPVLLHHIA